VIAAREAPTRDARSPVRRSPPLRGPAHRPSSLRVSRSDSSGPTSPHLPDVDQPMQFGSCLLTEQSDKYAPRIQVVNAGYGSIPAMSGREASAAWSGRLTREIPTRLRQHVVVRSDSVGPRHRPRPKSPLTLVSRRYLAAPDTDPSTGLRAPTVSAWQEVPRSARFPRETRWKETAGTDRSGTIRRSWPDASAAQRPKRSRGTVTSYCAVEEPGKALRGANCKGKSNYPSASFGVAETPRRPQRAGPNHRRA